MLARGLRQIKQNNRLSLLDRGRSLCPSNPSFLFNFFLLIRKLQQKQTTQPRFQTTTVFRRSFYGLSNIRIHKREATPRLVCTLSIAVQCHILPRLIPVKFNRRLMVFLNSWSMCNGKHCDTGFCTHLDQARQKRVSCVYGSSIRSSSNIR